MQRGIRRSLAAYARGSHRRSWRVLPVLLLAGAIAIYIASTARTIEEKKSMDEVNANTTPSAGNRPHGGGAGRELNRLSGEKSPYLLQHAANPVDWYPWGDAAFERARAEDKPIFLSIGYSTCHWCHVMERESFEDAEVAGLLNDTFICIKVDREERPDIDHQYMAVCQIMTGSGGWPLTIFMTPEKRPFFAATYIPKEDRFGRVGMLNLIPQVSDVWKSRREAVEQSAGAIVESLEAMAGLAPGGVVDGGIIEETVSLLRRRFDSVNGGFGTAPKFPSPHTLLFLLRYWKRSGDADVLSMVETSLRKMRLGGIYDHIGFGFHRYSTDAAWHLPHFEKMLYDQAMLLLAYTEAYQATGRPEYKQTAEEIIAYITRDMTGPTGGFFSAEDADSDGEEGRFYVWSVDQLREILDPDECALVQEWFAFSESGNFVDEAAQSRGGSNIFHLVSPLSQSAERNETGREPLPARWERIRRILFAERERRIRPQRDDKILTDWNGLTIAGLARAARAFDEPAYRERAERAAEFVLDTMSGEDGRLLHRFRDGEAALAAHLDDYAFFIWGLLELYRSSYETAWLDTALRLTGVCREHFWDEERGGFYFSADDGESLLVRSKELYDGALPSGNSVMMINLITLARMTGDSELERLAVRSAEAFATLIERNPDGYAFFVSALDFLTGPSREVVVVDGADPGETERMLADLDRIYLPHAVALRKRGEADGRLSVLAPFTKSLAASDGKATAYVCRGHACELPTSDREELVRKLRDSL